MAPDAYVQSHPRGGAAWEALHGTYTPYVLLSTQCRGAECVHIVVRPISKAFILQSHSPLGHP